MAASASCWAGPAATSWWAILLAPYLRKFGQYTVPDFLGARYGGNFARAAAWSC
jgi:Na+(H+)/acetate symporter ActP